MKTLLKDFQAKTVDELFYMVRVARGSIAANPSRPLRQAIVLSSATGSGKTLMTTALMETVINGDDQNKGDPAATFLWVTDQPDLNEQSRRKILETADQFGKDDVITIDSAFDQAQFDPGKIYFINTQKLGKDKYLVTRGDDRQYTIWETIAKTAKSRPGSFFVIMDEAHKGMMEKPKDREIANSIAQKFIKGSPQDGLEPILFLIGISATPERFHNLIQNVPNVFTGSVNVPIDDIRASGLLKDKVILYHPESPTATDVSLLKAAAERWKLFRDKWAAYSASEGLAEPVKPILIVQVEDGTAKAETKTDMAQALQVIESVIGHLTDDEVAHSFQEGHSLTVGSRSIRRISPPDIQQDQDVKVVFFKMSLNTGWDCPRAEVMMSFRRAVDYTSIAQLIGRMVRTPLARSVEVNEVLNTVALYLPNYDKAAVKQVIGRLSNPADDGVGSSVEDGSEFIELSRVKGAEECFERVENIPSYEVYRVARQPNTRRLVAFGRYLAQDGIRASASEESIALVVDQLVCQLQESSKDQAFVDRIAGLNFVRLHAVTMRFGEAETDESSDSTLIHDDNLDELFAACGRKLGEGLHLAFAKSRVATDGTSVAQAKREMIALLSDSSVLDSLENACQTQIEVWLKQYQPTIRDLTEQQRENYAKIRRTARKPEEMYLRLPATITGKTAGRSWQKHLYAQPDGTFPCVLTGWEDTILSGELGKSNIVAWLRNPPRKEWSFCVDYKDESADFASMYPDFFIFRDDGHGMILDILEPHRYDEGDTPRKILGLAEYADKHGGLFGRIEMITQVESKDFVRVNLNDEKTRASAKNVLTTGNVKQLFKDHGY